MKTLPGVPHPLGASWDGDGVNFALYSEHATGVDLCLFDEGGRETVVALVQCTGFVWHAYVPGLGPGQRYGYRVHGPYDPSRGLRFNDRVVLLDPYAKALDGTEAWDRGCYAYDLGDDRGDEVPTERPQLGVPRGVVIDTAFDWQGDQRPRTPLHQSVIYEAHVRGFTKLHPDVPPAQRGTYAGLAHPAVIRHLRDLGITAIELMPIQAFVDDKTLFDQGLRNYWGYSTIGYFAPDVRYRCGTALGSEVNELKSAIKALHRAGIEVILDVVYNHTAEGNHLGPTFNLKGIDNPTYYQLAEDRRYYLDYSGTGNTLDVRNPPVLAMVMDSLRYWAAEMHVDGFRFDLASALARSLHEVDRLSSFLTLIRQSPALADVKLIAEPWDVGEGGYQVGNFPVGWAEWNGRYRDSVRALWRGDGGRASEIGYRLTGSSDLYEANGRRPTASINFVTAHDGLTLHDLVESAPTCANDEAGVSAERRRQKRNLLSTLLLSQGTPMLLSGDEYGRSQGGNDNAYCHDDELSWFRWEWSEEERALFDFTRRVLRVRREHPALHRTKFFQGRGLRGIEIHDVAWLRADGNVMSTEDWESAETRSLGMMLAGRGIDDVDDQGRPLVDDNLLLFLNASNSPLELVLPVPPGGRDPWQLVIDTADDHAEERHSPGESSLLVARSMKLFRAPSRVVRTGGALHTLGATYRLQLSPTFGFREAAGVADYLRELGVTDVYSSPLLAACRGSTHGYDVVDHGRLNEQLGSAADFVAWSDRLRELGLGLLLDWVPNHMGIATEENPWWDDVLENGPCSIYADHFDIDWAPPKRGLEGRVLLPILGEQYGEILERGELTLVWERGVFRLAYFERRLPLSPPSVVSILLEVAARTGLPEDDPVRQELLSIVSQLRNLPQTTEIAPDRRKERAREKEVAKRRLAQLVGTSDALASALLAVVGEWNGTPGTPATFDRLDALLSEQCYRLASWKVAAEEINYRRFFDVNDLAALRMESPVVFEQAHALLFGLLDEGRVNALRLDHTDGLYDPYAYFESLQRRFTPSAGSGKGASPDDLARPIPLLIEKILEPGEQLSPTWPVDGTTGYELAVALAGLWVDPSAETALTAMYRRFTGDERSFADHVYESKRHILRFSLASEINVLARWLERIAETSRKWRDFTLVSLTGALVETLAAFPVYRTYQREGGALAVQDERRVRYAVRVARRRSPGVSATVFSFLEQILLARTEGDERAEHLRFALRFQQLSGPVMAKSVEDTAFYRYPRLVCLNDVGGLPSKLGTSIDEVHAQCAERARSWPLSMTTTSTHDSKRGEDAAARIAVLSEMPGDWRRAVHRWTDLAAGWKSIVDGEPAPGRRLEYLFYQSVVGAWPFGWDGAEGRDAFAARLAALVVKASKEAKEETSWTNPNVAYDDAVARFVAGMLGDQAFVTDVAAFCADLAPYGAANGLAQCLVRLCAPGVPDTYQGSELWNQSLVDPDNRTPVDFALRRRILASLGERKGDRRALAQSLLDRYQDGAVKLYVTHVALRARRERRELFLRGDYEGVAAGENVFAFTRGFESQRMLCLVPRFSYLRTRGGRRWAIGDVWGDDRARIPYSGRYLDVLTGVSRTVTGDVRLAEIFEAFPLALLIRHEA